MNEPSPDTLDARDPAAGGSAAAPAVARRRPAPALGRCRGDGELRAPPRYSSSTLILVAPEQLPISVVSQASTERVAQRLQTLRQEIESRTRLEMVARELDPYGTLGKEPLIDTIERMRDGVTMSVKGNDAFSITFDAPRPEDGHAGGRPHHDAVHGRGGGRARAPGVDGLRLHRDGARGGAPGARAEGKSAAPVQGAAHGPAPGAGAGQPGDAAAAAARAADGGREPAQGDRRAAADGEHQQPRARRAGHRPRARLALGAARADGAAQDPLHRRAPRRAGAAGPDRGAREGRRERPAGRARDGPCDDGGTAAPARGTPRGAGPARAARRRGPPHRRLPGRASRRLLAASRSSWA